MNNKNTANHNPHDFKELKHFKQQTIKLQCTFLIKKKSVFGVNEPLVDLDG